MIIPINARDAILPGIGAAVVVSRQELDNLLQASHDGAELVGKLREEIDELRQHVGELHEQRCYLKTKQAADYTGFSESTLETLRSDGGGPRFVKHGGIVIYDTRDLDAWLETRKVSHTAEADERYRLESAARAREGLTVAK